MIARVLEVIGALAVLLVICSVVFVTWLVFVSRAASRQAGRDYREAREAQVREPTDAEINQMTSEYYKKNRRQQDG